LEQLVAHSLSQAAELQSVQRSVDGLVERSAGLLGILLEPGSRIGRQLANLDLLIGQG
jgi:hypothetical protein